MTRRTTLRRAMAAACLWAMMASPCLARPAPSNQDRTAHALDQLRHDPSRLHILLAAMPKGGDLHSHLGGAIDAESYLAWAAQDHACIDPVAMTLTPPPCAPGMIAADSEAAHALSSRLIGALSMRNFVASPNENAHDHFFAAFAKFGAIGLTHEAAMLAQARNRAALGGLTYVEMMWFPGIARAQALATDIPDDAVPATMQPRLATALDDLARDISAHIDTVEQQEAALMHCGQPEAQAGCGVTLRYMPYALRNQAPHVVFAQVSLAFALAARDPRVAGVNLVAPEDDPVALRDIARHMAMFAFLEQRYPEVPVSLHAGELAPGLVPTQDLRFHIRAAVQDGGARRVGHGVAIVQESDAPGLLRQMAARHTLVEINLTSNDVILGVAGRNHPLPLYLAAHVPVALSTDDQGVSRSDITREYETAVESFGLGYADLKTMARNSLEYAFMPGESLWRTAVPYRMARACLSPQAASCHALLARSQKARLQIDLERRLAAFEARAWQADATIPLPHRKAIS